MDSPPHDDSVYVTALNAVEACVRELYDAAVRVQDDYLAHVDAIEAKSKGWESRSNLQLSCLMRGSSLELRWTGIKWYGPKNNRVSVRVSIKKKADGFSYGTDKLKVFAKEWELEKVIETEAKLQVIRRKAKHLVNASTSIRNVMKFPKELEDSASEE